MDPMTLAAILNFAGGVASGAGSGQVQAQQQKENYTMQKRQQAESEAQLANQLANQSQTAGVRDEGIYNLEALGGPQGAQQAFNPTSFLSGANSGPQGVGGANLTALAAHQAAYTPGAGGVTT